MRRDIDRSSLKTPDRVSVLLLVVGMFASLFTVAFGNVGVVRAAGTPGGNVADPVVRAVDIAKPAVVRIFTVVSGHLVVNFSPNNSVTFPQGNNKSYQLEISGSGTFISANGDILTADHVVNPPAQVLQDAAGQDVANYINKHPETGQGQTSATQVTQLLQSGQVKSSAKFDFAKSEAFLSTDYTGPLTGTDLNSVPAQIHMPIDRIEKESAVNQKDVAIVHAGFTDTPDISLGNSSTVQEQDQLTIIGFPGNGDVSMRPTDLLTSSVNTIAVSSIKTTDSGAPLIQVAGNVEQGDSGGPALDNSGSVVGVVSFGVANTAGSTSFLQASNSARTLVQSLNLNTKPGRFQQLWSQAFSDYSSQASGHWHKAAQELKQLSTTYPQFKAVSTYLNYAQSQAQHETTTTTTTQVQSQPVLSARMALAIAIGAVVLLLLLVVVLFATSIRRRKQKERTGMLTPPPVPITVSSPPGSAQRSQPLVGPQQQWNTPNTYGSIPAMPPQNNMPHSNGSNPQAYPAPQPVVTPPPVSQPLSPSSGPVTNTTATLRTWPCGHMNRANARFCSICGEPAPEPPTIRRSAQP